LSYDITILGTNKLIEVNGDFWHANPIFYKENDIMICGSYRPLAKEVWAKDARKKEFAVENGHQILTTWEYELKHNKEVELKRILDWCR
jgi:G:T-mismatch repair DNA endonuclease (very short patch repair protein)